MSIKSSQSLVEEAIKKISEVISSLDVVGNLYKKKQIKLKNNPGFLTTILQEKFKNTINITIENINDLFYIKSIEGEASDDEIDYANNQLNQIFKSLGLGVLTVLPFSPITIPFVIKKAQELGIDIIPNWYKKL